MRHSVRTFPAAVALVATGVAGLSGCQSMQNRERGAVIGGAVGAAAGAVIGKHQGSTAKGAIVGAVLGGAAGAIIGHQMDQRAKEIDQSVPGATVERVGEGILVTFESGLLFPFDSDELKPEARTNLTNLANNLDKFPNTDLLIVGHTDSRGTDEYNQTLSERRAAAARSFLISQGVDANRIRTMGLGETEPKATNDTAEGQAQNRRVEVAIYANEQLREQAKKQAGTP